MKINIRRFIRRKWERLEGKTSAIDFQILFTRLLAAVVVDKSVERLIIRIWAVIIQVKYLFAIIKKNFYLRWSSPAGPKRRSKFVDIFNINFDKNHIGDGKGVVGRNQIFEFVCLVDSHFQIEGSCHILELYIHVCQQRSDSVGEGDIVDFPGLISRFNSI